MYSIVEDLYWSRGIVEQYRSGDGGVGEWYFYCYCVLFDCRSDA